VTRGDGYGLDDATDVIEAGRVVELGSVNTRLIAENSAQAQDKGVAARPVAAIGANRRRPMVDRVTILAAPAGYGKRGPLFSASVDGRTIVTASVTPLLDAARVLAAEGHDPATILVLRHAGSATDALRSTIGAAAKLTVVEEGDGAPRFRPWKAFSHPAVAPPMRQTEEACTTPPAPDVLAAPEAFHGKKGRRAGRGGADARPG
jgi:hypothetical protein